VQNPGRILPNPGELVSLTFPFNKYFARQELMVRKD